MAVIQCNFTVPSAINGGKLTGNGFNGVPTLTSGDSLQVVVRWGGASPPAQLNGYYIVSPAPSAPNQTLGSMNAVWPGVPTSPVNGMRVGLDRFAVDGRSTS